MAELDLSQFEGHTPGPWESDGSCVRIYQDGRVEFCVAGGAADPPGMMHSNARLIAAAPQLLAELREARARVEKLEDEKLLLLRELEKLMGATQALVSATERQRGASNA